MNDDKRSNGSETASSDLESQPPVATAPSRAAHPNKWLGTAQRVVGYDPEVSEATPNWADPHRLTSNLPQKGLGYVKSLFPIADWILHYNLTWGIGDLIAGLTVGMVVVPQSLAYARIATLPIEVGLYSSFVGVVIYCFFATSKDVTIGPVAVMSLETAKVIAGVREKSPQFDAQTIATALAFICGFIVLGIGLLRLGWLVEFISAPAVAGFMTGSAINIAAGQFPALMGYNSRFNTRESTYKVIINSLKNLPYTNKNAAFGLISLFVLYAIRFTCNRFEQRAKTERARKIAFFINTLRSAFVLIFTTLGSWLYLRKYQESQFPISVLKSVPAGFRNLGQPTVTPELLSSMGEFIPVSVIILLLEHIAIAKSFGRINNYKIRPDQELIAIGVANTIGTLFGAYPSTGSFSRTAIKSKAGVRTPLAGWVTAITVIIALYALTDAFYWIPNAALSAVIIHAVGDLIVGPKQSFGFWKVSPLEFLIFLAAVLASIFDTIETGIYVSVGASAALLLYRVARPRGKFLGRVRLEQEIEETGEETSPDQKTDRRDVYLPLNPDGVRNPLIVVQPPPPGIIVFRFEESFLYPNASFYMDIVADYAKQITRPGVTVNLTKQGDRPWNDPGERTWRFPWEKKRNSEAVQEQKQILASKPVLRAVVFDFSSVSHLDTTSVQNLIDLRRVLERYAGGEVPFHFASILSPWIKRALLAGGFGKGQLIRERPLEIAAVTATTTDPELRRQATNFKRRFPPSAPTSPPNGQTGHTTAAQLGISSLGEIDESRYLKTNSQREWSDSASEKAPVVNVKHQRFHLDLSTAVLAAAGVEDW